MDLKGFSLNGNDIITIDELTPPQSPERRNSRRRSTMDPYTALGNYSLPLGRSDSVSTIKINRLPSRNDGPTPQWDVLMGGGGGGGNESDAPSNVISGGLVIPGFGGNPPAALKTHGSVSFSVPNERRGSNTNINDERRASHVGIDNERRPSHAGTDERRPSNAGNEDQEASPTRQRRHSRWLLPPGGITRNKSIDASNDDSLLDTNLAIPGLGARVNSVVTFGGPTFGADDDEDSYGKENVPPSELSTFVPTNTSHHQSYLSSSSHIVKKRVGIDANNGLPIWEVGGSLSTMTGVIVYWVDDVTQITYKGRHLGGRALVVTDTSLFLCGVPDGRIGRCIKLRSIARIITSEASPEEVLFIIPTEYDLLIKLYTEQDCDELIETVQTAYRVVSHAVELRREVVGSFNDETFSLKRPEKFNVNVLPQRSIQHIRKEAGSGPVGVKAAARLTEKERALNAIEMQRVEAEDESKRQLRQIANLEKDLAENNRKTKKNEKIIAQLKEKVQEVEERVIKKNGRLLSEEEMKEAKAKQDVISEMEDELEQLQKQMFETQQPAGTLGDLTLRIKNTFYGNNIPMPSSLVLPESVPLGRLVEALEDSLADLNHRHNQLLEKTIPFDDLQQQANERSEILNWMEKATLEAGLGYLSEFGSISGINGPWKEYNPADHRKGEESEEKVSQTSTEDVLEMEGALLVNGVVLPEKGFTSPDELELDPRTGLKLASVPGHLREQFRDACDTVLYCFEQIITKTGIGKKHLHNRYLLISDRCLYVCDPEGAIKRCIDVLDLVDCFLDSGGARIGLRLEKEHDLLIQFNSSSQLDRVVEAIVKLQSYLNDGMHKRIVLRQLAVGKKLEERLNLYRAPGWNFQLIPLRTKKELMDEINKKLLHGSTPELEERKKQETVDRVWDPMKVAMTKEFEESLDDENTEIGRLRQRVKEKEKVIAGHTLEIIDLTREIMEDKTADLSDSNAILAKYKRPKQNFDPSQSRYSWIPVTPIILDTGLDVVKVRYHVNTIATTHKNGWVQLWDIESLLLMHTLRDHTACCNDVLFYSTGKEAHEFDIFSCSSDTTIRRYESESGEQQSILQTHRGPVLCLSLSENRLASGGKDTVINVWDVSKVGEEAPVSVLKGHRNEIISLHLDGPLLISAEWGWIFMWDVESAAMTKAMRDEYGGICCLTANTDLIISCGNSGDVNIWDMAQGTSVTIHGTGDDILACQIVDNYIITTGADCKVRSWDISTLQMADLFHNSYPNPSLSFQCDYKRFVCSEGKYLRMWLKE
eukprot:TRINITY_DN16577_c0_g1_i1.p1 TRINITY_DN16577_c0_g1~~TRINITY_DN16577_c0_g1_i1.p1  ORF type:complete len:1276 (+),score=273.43 TRINITY_DN16577_c0_g1_i1:306-4133(+)